MQIHELITELLTALLGHNRNDARKHTDSKFINIVQCESCKKWLLAADYVTLIIYYNQAAKNGALCKCQNEPTGQPASNPSSLDCLEYFHAMLNELMVLVY